MLRIIYVLLVMFLLQYQLLADLNVPKGWSDGGGTSPIFPAAVEEGLPTKQVVIGSSSAVTDVALTVVGSHTVSGKMAVGTTTTSNTSTLVVAGSITVTQSIIFQDMSSLSSATGVAVGTMTLGSVTSALGYTPVANTQGSITSALGYTPVANVVGSITSALGYTPVANTQGSITSALGYTPINNTNGTGSGIALSLSSFDTGTITNSTLGTGTSFLGNLIKNQSGDIYIEVGSGSTLYLGSSTTGANTVKINNYDSRVNRVFLVSPGTGTTLTGTTTTTNLWAGTVTGGLLGITGKIVWRAFLDKNVGSNAVTLSMKIGGKELGSYGTTKSFAAANTILLMNAEMWNAGSTTYNYSKASDISDHGAGTAGNLIGSSTINFGNDVSLILTGTLGTSTDNVNLRRSEVVLYE